MINYFQQPASSCRGNPVEVQRLPSDTQYGYTAARNVLRSLLCRRSPLRSLPQNKSLPILYFCVFFMLRDCTPFSFSILFKDIFHRIIAGGGWVFSVYLLAQCCWEGGCRSQLSLLSDKLICFIYFFLLFAGSNILFLQVLRVCFILVVTNGHCVDFLYKVYNLLQYIDIGTQPPPTRKFLSLWGFYFV